MALTRLYSPDSASLKIGPPPGLDVLDATGATKVATIVFEDGIADVDLEDPQLAAMVAHTEERFPLLHEE